MLFGVFFEAIQIVLLVAQELTKLFTLGHLQKLLEGRKRDDVRACSTCQTEKLVLVIIGRSLVSCDLDKRLGRQGFCEVVKIVLVIVSDCLLGELPKRVYNYIVIPSNKGEVVKGQEIVFYLFGIHFAVHNLCCFLFLLQR